MCCRYYFDETAGKNVRRIADRVEQNLNLTKQGDIHPAETAVIIAGNNDELYAGSMQWGFQGFEKQLVINARAESVLDKRTFRESVLCRRCVIPAAGFYEWTASGQKVTFTSPQKDTLYMAGFYRKYEDQLRFIIITTAANESMRRIHDRMPLILREEQLAGWICQGEEWMRLLRMPSPELERIQEYEQLSLFENMNM